MTSKRYLFLPLSLVLLSHGQTSTGHISASYFHTSTLKVVGFFAIPIMAYRLLFAKDPVQGKHNPDHDTVCGGTFYGAKWGSALGALARFLVCPSQLKNYAQCTCSLNTNVTDGLICTAAGATLGAVVGYARATSLDKKHSSTCAEELLELTPYQQELISCALEFETADSPEDKHTLYQKISALNSIYKYPLLNSHADFELLKTRFLRIVTYLNRALDNEELGHHDIELINQQIQSTKNILPVIENIILFIGDHPVFHDQQKEKDERE